MLQQIAEILVKSRVNRDTRSRKKKYVPWDKAQRLALIVSSDQVKNKSVLDKYIESTKKYVEVFVIETEIKEPSFADWHCLVKKDRSFLKLPKRTALAEYKGKQFDVLVNACPDTDLFATSLTSALSASLKCGRSDRYNDTDIIIKGGPNFDLIRFLNELTGYLKTIRD